jgi:OmpA-OmpF porin, OOP family
MKKIAVLLAFIICSQAAQAQSKGKQVLNRAKTKTNDRVDQKADQAIDIGLDKIEEGVKSIFKKKKKSTTTDNTSTNDESNTTNGNISSTSDNANTQNNNSNKVKANGKFDFEPGQKVIQFDDFSRLSEGDFPAEYNSNTTGEIVTINGKSGKWLSLTKNGCIVPDYMKNLPDNFTLEFEVGINTDPTNNLRGLGLNFTTVEGDLLKDMFFKKGNAVVHLHPGAASAHVFVNPLNGSELDNDIPMPNWNSNESVNKNFAKISVWRQKGRLRVYVDEQKIIDIPRFFVESKPYSFAMFRNFFGDCEVYIANIRYAIAGQDLRAKLSAEGRFSTTGITFDVNSDKIKTESKSTLDEIGTLLLTNSDIKLKIVGHTDSDGDANANKILSLKRANAIRNKLQDDYGIESTRLQVDGKGEDEPLNNNSTPADKAANRRVEFIKI